MKLIQSTAPLWLTVVLLAVALFAQAPGPAAAAQNPTIVWRVATMAPRGVGWAKEVENILLPFVDEVSDGDVGLKIFWGGVLGDDEALIGHMKSGRIQSAGLAAAGATMACPEFAVVELPFLFNNYEEVDFVREKMMDSFREKMRTHGYELFLWVDQDFDQLYSVKTPLAQLEDFQGVRFATWHGPLEKHLLQVLGAKGEAFKVPDIPSAVRSGKVDAIIAPALWVLGTQLYSTVRYINPMKIRYSPSTIVVENKAWGQMPLAYRNRAKTQLPEITKKFVLGTRREADEAIKAMVQYGVRQKDTDSRNLQKIQVRSRAVWDDMAGALYPQSLLDELLGHLDDFRAGGKSP